MEFERDTFLHSSPYLWDRLIQFHFGFGQIQELFGSTAANHIAGTECTFGNSLAWVQKLVGKSPFFDLFFKFETKFGLACNAPWSPIKLYCTIEINLLQHIQAITFACFLFGGCTRIKSVVFQYFIRCLLRILKNWKKLCPIEFCCMAVVLVNGASRLQLVLINFNLVELKLY